MCYTDPKITTAIVNISAFSREKEPEREHLGEVGRPQASDRVPAGLRGEADGATAGVRTVRDVVERMPERARVDLRGKLEKGEVNGRRVVRTVGLMKPMGFLPMARRASLMAEKIDAETGDDADVP